MAPNKKGKPKGPKAKKAKIIDGITPSTSKKKNKGRKRISIEVKLAIYEKQKAGVKNKDLVLEYGLSKSTISTIYNEVGAQKLEDARTQMLSPKLVCIQNIRPAIQSDLEDILLEWMNLNLSRRIPMNQKMVQAKALAIFKYLSDPVNNLFDISGKRIKLGEKTSVIHSRRALGPAYIPIDNSDPDEPDEVPSIDLSPQNVEENLPPNDYVGFSQTDIIENYSSNRASILFEASKTMQQDTPGDTASNASTEPFYSDNDVTLHLSDSESECELFGNQSDKVLNRDTIATPWRYPDMDESSGLPVEFSEHEDSMDIEPSITNDTPDTLDVQFSDTEDQDVVNDESEAGSSTPRLKRFTFKASGGWYRNCVQNRWGYFRINLAGEAESADLEAATAFIPIVTNFIIKYIKDPSKVYNVDEMGIYYKKVPTSALVKEGNRMRGFKPNRKRVTALVGGNMAGEKLKPLVIGHSAKPRDFGNVDKASLPCYYESNQKAWMTSSIYWKWYLECFIPECEARHGPDFTVLLLVDNCTSHPEVVGTLDPRVIVMFLPPNTTSLIQPMDQGVIKNLKLRFHAILYDELIEHIDTTPISTQGAKPLVEFYKGIKMLRVINLLGKAWNEVKDTTIQRSWNKLLDKNLLREHEAFKEFAGPAPVENPDPAIEPAPEDDPEDENNIENNVLLEEIVSNFNSCPTLGCTVSADISEVIEYNAIDLDTAELCQVVLEDKQSTSKAIHQHDKVSDHMGLTKNLQAILIAYANLQEAVLDNIQDTPTTEVIMSHFEKGIKFVTDELANRHNQFQQADIRDWFVSHGSTGSTARKND